MNSTLRFLSWEERAEHFEMLARAYRKIGNRRDEEFATINAATMRLCAAEGVDIHA